MLLFLVFSYHFVFSWGNFLIAVCGFPKKFYAIFFYTTFSEGRRTVHAHKGVWLLIWPWKRSQILLCNSDDPQPPPPPPRFDKKKRKSTVDHNRNKLDQVDEQDEELVYCTKGSLCSRRSKATLLSTSTRNIKGQGLLITCKVKQRPAVNVLIPPSNCSPYYGTQFLSKTQRGALHLTQHILQTTSIQYAFDKKRLVYFPVLWQNERLAFHSFTIL